MGILSNRKNKKFEYVPRYYDDKGEGNPFKLKRKFDKYRSTVDTPSGLKGKFKAAWGELKESRNKKSDRTVLFLIILLVLLFLYIIDFDLSVFTQPL